MTKNPEKESGAFQSDTFQNDAFQTQNEAPEPHRVLGPLSFLRRAAAWLTKAIRLLPFLTQIPRRFMAGIAAVLILFGVTREWRTPPLPSNSPPPRLLGLTWWTSPRQLHAERTLPSFDNAVIECVAVVPNSIRVWIAGDAGLLAYSIKTKNSWQLRCAPEKAEDWRETFGSL